MIKLFQPYVNKQAKLNVARVLNGTQLAEGPEVKLFEEEFAYHVTFADGDVEVIEVVLGSGAAEATVADLEVGDRFRVAAVRRPGATIIPSADFVLAPGDLVVAAARAGVATKIRKFLDDPGAA